MSGRESDHQGYGPNGTQVERLLQERKAFINRAEEVAEGLAAAEHRRRKGDITEREKAVARMHQVIKDDAELRMAATAVRIELSNRWMLEFNESLAAPWAIARCEARRRGGADALAVHRITEREKKAERVREEALLALVARKNLPDDDFRLIYKPAGRIAPLGRIEGWGRYGPNTTAVNRLLLGLKQLTMDQWVRAAATHYRLGQGKAAGYAAAIASMKYGLTSDPLDRRDTEIGAAEEAAINVLATNWQPITPATGCSELLTIGVNSGYGTGERNGD